jgi:hypothetical protein
MMKMMMMMMMMSVYPLIKIFKWLHNDSFIHILCRIINKFTTLVQESLNYVCREFALTFKIWSKFEWGRIQIFDFSSAARDRQDIFTHTKYGFWYFIA